MHERGVAQVTRAIANRLDGSPIALMLDIDGTLSPIAPTPSAATIPEATQQVLRSFAAQPDVAVALVTGRSIADARRMVTVEGVWIVGTHGMETRSPAGDVIVSDSARSFEQAIRAAVVQLTAIASTVPGSLVEDKRWVVTLHYRMADPETVPALVARAEQVGASTGLRMLHGKRMVELRPPIDVNKGTACVALAEQIGALRAGGAVLYAGDDRTDEDAFEALRARERRSVTVRVAPSGDDAAVQTTRAEFVLQSTDEVRELLEWLYLRRAKAAARV